MEKQYVSDRPVKLSCNEDLSVEFGSDAIVEQLSRLGLTYIALVPGSSYRGIHDSLINYNGNKEPQMLLCLHEEHSIAIAHGYAKVTERPMAAAVHANVGLQHAAMAIYNAFADRTPVVVLGATGPVDNAKKRPWIDWIHSATDQAAIVRPYTKFDDEPRSVNAALNSLLRCASLSMEKPCAPTYLCMDVRLQEDRIDPNTLKFPKTDRFLHKGLVGPSQKDINSVTAELRSANRPLFLFGRVDRSQEGWQDRISLAEICKARVMTDLKQACAFPTAHALHACPPGVFNSPRASETIRTADLIISFDWIDLAGTLSAAWGDAEPSNRIVHISLDSILHNGWSKDHFGHPPVDIPIFADPNNSVKCLLQELRSAPLEPFVTWAETSQPLPSPNGEKTTEKIFMSDLASVLYTVLPPDDMCLVRVPLGWRGDDLRATHPLSFLGQDGGAGIGSGPGQAVGAALALKDSPLVPVAILGDGDFLMASSALWTASRYRLPLLVIVANNASFFNDEVHQERVARERCRPLENKWIGIRLDDPLPDITQNAKSFGLSTPAGGQVKEKSKLGDVLLKAVQEAKTGKAVLVDMQVLPDGYGATMK
ncbi:MAG: hypothetical protein Q9157_003229 [Trypethelium eluteriae]